MNETFRTIFDLDKKTLILLLNKLCKGKINEIDKTGGISENEKIHKESINDIPKKIKIPLYGSITIDSEGIHYRGEHGYENVEIAEFNEFFDINKFLDSLEYDEDEFFLNDDPTQRGFSKIQFKERNGAICSIQKSSSADGDYIWFGPNKFGIKEFKNGNWIDRTDLDVHEMDHHFVGNNRMHLSREMVAKLLPILEHFVGTGDVKF